MKLSIVTPTLNSYKFIKECADSILIHQNYNNIEWIVADGGSTDGTFEYLKDLKNNKIILINENLVTQLKLIILGSLKHQAI